MSAELVHSARDPHETARILEFVDWMTQCLDTLAELIEQPELDRAGFISDNEIAASYATLETVLEGFATVFSVSLVHVPND